MSECTAAATVCQYSTFFVCGHCLGLDVLRVQEVLRYQPMTRIPLANPVIEGLINLRGQIVAALDMRRRLKLPPRAADAKPMNMVIAREDGAVSLLVDSIGDVLEVDAAQGEPPPANLDVDILPMVERVHKLEDRLLLILDVDRVINV